MEVMDAVAPTLTPDEQWRRWVERWTWHVDQLPGLLEVMRGEVVPLASTRYDAVRVDVSRDGAPVPFRVDVVDSIDDLWAALVLYAENVRDLTGGTMPTVAQWRTRGEVAGIRPGADVRRDAFAVVAWLVDRVDLIAPLEQLGDSEDHLFGMIRSLRARYVTAPVPRPKRRMCTTCGDGEVVVRFVDDGTPKGARIARCDVCGEEFG